MFTVYCSRCERAGRARRRRSETAVFFSYVRCCSYVRVFVHTSVFVHVAIRFSLFRSAQHLDIMGPMDSQRYNPWQPISRCRHGFPSPLTEWKWVKDRSQSPMVMDEGHGRWVWQPKKLVECGHWPTTSMLIILGMRGECSGGRSCEREDRARRPLEAAWNNTDTASFGRL